MERVCITSIRPAWRHASDGQPLAADDWAPIIELIRQAARQGACLALLPEDVFNMMACGYAESFDGPVCRMIRQQAQTHRLFIAFPFVRDEEGQRFNTTAIFGPDGRVVGWYDKTHLTFLEQRRYGLSLGQTLPVIDLGAFKIGVVTCADALFPETVRCLALDGADLILLPHQMAEPDDEFFRVMIRSRAQDNCVPLVTASFADQPHRRWFRNYIVDARGRILTEGPSGVGLSIAQVTLRDPVALHDYVEPGAVHLQQIVRRYRRPELYESLTARHLAKA
ncbi:MAG TPA: carbon-nitrogen hydrolase family protein [Phycisphaeraceae bacterium]